MTLEAQMITKTFMKMRTGSRNTARFPVKGQFLPDGRLVLSSVKKVRIISILGHHQRRRLRAPAKAISVTATATKP